MADLSGLPVIGPWARKIGNVQDMLSIPCATTPELWVKGFFAAAPKMIWSLYKPDLMDIRFSRAGGPHGRRKTPHLQFGKVISARDVAKFGKFGIAAFALAELAQTAGWWFLVIDAGVDLSFNWVSTVYEYAGCKPPTGTFCQLATDPAQICLPGFNHIPDWAFVGGDVRWDAVDGIIVPAGMNGGVSCGISVRKWDPVPVPPPRLSARLVNETENKEAARWDIPPPAPGTPVQWGGTFGKVGRKGYDRLYRVHYDNLGGYGLIADSTLSMTDADAENPLADP